MKKSQQSVWQRIPPLSYWYFLGAFLFFAGMAIFALRANNLQAIRLRDQVLSVDEQNGDVEAALKELREYVYAHMNTDLSSGTGVQQPVQLKYRYERLVAAEKARVEQVNSNIYTAAQAHCEALYPASTSGGPRVPCIEQYVAENGAKEQPIPDALYKFDFEPPRWSPDLAGWSLVLAGIFFVLFVFRFITQRWARFTIRQD